MNSNFLNLLWQFLVIGEVFRSETHGQEFFISCNLELTHFVSAYFVTAFVNWTLAEDVCETHNLALTTNSNIIETCVRQVLSESKRLYVWSNKGKGVCYCTEFQYGKRTVDYLQSCSRPCGFICYKDISPTMKTTATQLTTSIAKLSSTMLIPPTTSATRRQNVTNPKSSVTTSITSPIQEKIPKQTTISSGAIAGLVVGLLLLLFIFVVILILIVLTKRGLIKLGNHGRKPNSENPGITTVTTDVNYFEVEPHTLCQEDHSVAPHTVARVETGNASDFRLTEHGCTLYDETYLDTNLGVKEISEQDEIAVTMSNHKAKVPGYSEEKTVATNSTYDHINKPGTIVLPDNVYSHTKRGSESEYSHIDRNNSPPDSHSDMYNHVGSVTSNKKNTDVYYDHFSGFSTNNGRIDESTYSHVC